MRLTFAVADSVLPSRPCHIYDISQTHSDQLCLRFFLSYLVPKHPRCAQPAKCRRSLHLTSFSLGISSPPRLKSSPPSLNMTPPSLNMTPPRLKLSPRRLMSSRLRPYQTFRTFPPFQAMNCANCQKPLSIPSKATVTCTPPSIDNFRFDQTNIATSTMV